ncbi:ABC transporter permease [Halosimplex amylolyticum]|uniref:ABC transporter permease n=1 Tax=Halosimplex amylolyticum TaxID=3396616 RepID=UPI003F54E635
MSNRGSATVTDADDSPFDVRSDVEITTVERYRRWLDRSVLAPLRIAADDWRTVVGWSIIFGYILMGTVGAWLVEPTELNEGEALVPPFQTMEFPLGTNGVGEGIFAKIVHATPEVLLMSLTGATFAVFMAIVIGVTAGYVGGLTDRVLSTLIDSQIAIPGLPLVILLAIFVEPKNPFIIGLILSIDGWPGLARALRSEVLSVKNESYVEAARIMGDSKTNIMRTDVLPNLLPFIGINFMNTARNIIFAAVGLYFIGALPYSLENWGIMLNKAYNSTALFVPEAFHWLFFPMLAIVVYSMGLVLIAQGTDRLFNPRIRARHAETVDDDPADIQ